MSEELKQQKKRERIELRKKQEAREEIIRKAASESLSASRSCHERISFSSIPMRRLIGDRDDE